MRARRPKVKVNGERYSLVVLHVLERDAFGRPSKVEVGYDDTTFKLYDGIEFVTSFIPAHIAKPKSTNLQ